MNKSKLFGKGINIGVFHIQSPIITSHDINKNILSVIIKLNDDRGIQKFNKTYILIDNLILHWYYLSNFYIVQSLLMKFWSSTD